ncbi:MAG: hypothetical protein LBL98_02295 [Ruminococcus sp.]|jgi:hypothetical protein|nr:hypothetical protein [Ruminococcus sp.]
MSVFDIRAAFEYARECVAAEQAALRYGIELNRGHRARCPFHDGKDFNLSFHGGGYRCFVCGVSGDSVGFTRLLFGYQKPIEALKRLNNDFGLGLDLEAGKPEAEHHTTLKQIKQIRRNAAERDLPEAVRRILWEYSLDLDWVQRNLAPKTPEDEPADVWVYALQNLSYAEYILDSFDNMTPENKLIFAIKKKEMITEYENVSRLIDGLRRRKNAA